MQQQGDARMIRKLMLPVLAIALLGGCATSAYQYRGGQGDYYYGQPSTQYRYYSSPYGYYGSPYGYYGSPYGYSGYGYGYYGNGGRYGYPYLPRGHYRGDGHDHGHGHEGRNHGDRDHDGDRDKGDHHGGRNPNSGNPPDGRLGIDGQPPMRPDRGPGFRPGPPWRDPGNPGISSPDRPYRGPATTRPQPTAPAVRSSRDGSVGSRASGGITEGASTDPKPRRIHKP